jgi:carbonic anhydrase
MVQVGKDLPNESKAAIAAAVKNNALHQARVLTQHSTIIKDFADSGRVKIVPAYYSLGTGKVEWLHSRRTEN